MDNIQKEGGILQSLLWKPQILHKIKKIHNFMNLYKSLRE
jgi:hypothetical protein